MHILLTKRPKWRERGREHCINPHTDPSTSAQPLAFDLTAHLRTNILTFVYVCGCMCGASKVLRFKPFAAVLSNGGGGKRTISLKVQYVLHAMCHQPDVRFAKSHIKHTHTHACMHVAHTPFYRCMRANLYANVSPMFKQTRI